MRIHEFAKKISKDSKEVIAILAANGIEGKKTMSSISEDEMNLVLEKSHTEKGGNKPEKKQEKEESPKNRRNHNRKKEGNKTAEKNKNTELNKNMENKNTDSRNMENKEIKSTQNRNAETGNKNKENKNRETTNRETTNREINGNTENKTTERNGGNENNKGAENSSGGRHKKRNNRKTEHESGNSSSNGKFQKNEGDKHITKVFNPQNSTVKNNGGKNNKNNTKNNKPVNNSSNNANNNTGNNSNNTANNNTANNNTSNNSNVKGNNKNNNRTVGKNTKNTAGKPANKGNKPAPAPQPVKKEEEIKVITIPEVITIGELADKMKMQSSALIKKLFMQGMMLNVNQEVDFETAESIALEFDIIAEQEEKIDVIEELLKEEEEDESTMIKRPPVVCVMGHVDHGKTSLLDAIRKTNVISGEAGGITQHIGAYVVNYNGEKITFLDTPGHEAFTAMRMRGAQATDIAILVVAADDGVMPQTVEAISHAKAAGISIIVAVNKIDKPSANVEKVKQELAEYELLAEDWGGETVFVPVSAHTREGLDQLLEMVLLTAEINELKANPNRKARGVVIEAKLDKGRGPVATVLIQKGILKSGDAVAIGSAYGRVRAMVDDNGGKIKEAGPSTPVEILGLNSVPNAGEVLMATKNEKEARSIAETFIKEGREKLLEGTKAKAKMTLDDVFNQIQAGNLKELNIIVKADVQGSVEAVKQSLVKLSNDEVVVKVIHGGVGTINESDVTLASASNAIIIGFNVRPDNTAKETAEHENVDLRLYKVIYQAIEDVEAAMKGMLDPVFEEKVIGHAEIRQLFKSSGVGMIAGSYVLDGYFQRGCKIRISREGKQIYEGELASLKRFKDDVKEVKAGYECGLVFEGFTEFTELDIAEAYIMVEVPR